MFSWSDFHFIRPFWLLLMLFSPLFLYLPRIIGAIVSPWAKVIDPHLLPHVVKEARFTKKNSTRFLIPCLIAFISLSLAGPTVKKIPLDVSFTKAPIIICLELSDEMLSDRVSPSRLRRAMFKIEDFLKHYQGAEVSLIAYAGDAHTVVPFTNDYQTLSTLLKVLNPDLMPKRGNDVTSALSIAKTMMIHQPQARVLVMASSSFQDEDFVKDLKKSDLPLILWSFKEERINSTTQFDGSLMAVDFSAGLNDAKSIASSLESKEHSISKNQVFYDTWSDLGPYVLILVLLMFLLSVFLSKEPWWLFSLVLVLPGNEGRTSNWFYSKEKQADLAFANKDYEKAAELSNDDMRKGAALFRAKKYDQAASYFQKVTSSEGYYNLGNALAQAGKISQAIAAYENALKADSSHADAKFNKELLEKKQQQEQEKKDNQSENQKQNQKEQREQKENKPENQKESQQEKDSQDNKPNQDASSRNNNKEKKEDKAGEKKPHEEPIKSKEQKQEEEITKGDSKQQIEEQKTPPQNLDPQTRYYFDQAQDNSLYLKRKFLYESKKRKQ